MAEAAVSGREEAGFGKEGFGEGLKRAKQGGSGREWAEPKEVGMSRISDRYGKI